ncbi:MAG TPA: hypothetical protein VIY86_00220 [Pirellulaceae bacterium]
MFVTLFDRLQAGLALVIGQSGLVSSGHGVPPGRHDPLEVAIAGILGGLGGFIVGLLLGRVARFIAYAAGRDLKTGKWAVYGAILGAIIAGIWENYSG